MPDLLIDRIQGGPRCAIKSIANMNCITQLQRKYNNRDYEIINGYTGREYTFNENSNTPGKYNFKRRLSIPQFNISFDDDDDEIIERCFFYIQTDLEKKSWAKMRVDGIDFVGGVSDNNQEFIHNTYIKTEGLDVPHLKLALENIETNPGFHNFEITNITLIPNNSNMKARWRSMLPKPYNTSLPGKRKYKLHLSYKGYKVDESNEIYDLDYQNRIIFFDSNGRDLSYRKVFFAGNNGINCVKVYFINISSNRRSDFYNNEVYYKCYDVRSVTEPITQEIVEGMINNPSNKLGNSFNRNDNISIKSNLNTPGKRHIVLIKSWLNSNPEFGYSQLVFFDII